MEDYHYAHLIKTFGKMRTDVVVSVTLALFMTVFGGQHFRQNIDISISCMILHEDLALIGLITHLARESIFLRRCGSQHTALFLMLS